MLEHWDCAFWNWKKPIFIVIDRLVVRLFAGAREQVGSDFIAVDVVLPISALQLKEAIVVHSEPLRTLVKFARIAIDNEFICDSAIIDGTYSHSEIALIPPVSGG